MGHSMQIAQAMSYEPISLVLLVVKADQRFDTTLDNIQHFAEKFMDFEHLMAVCVTHMDLTFKCPTTQVVTPLQWSESELTAKADQEFGITKMIYSRKNVSASSLVSGILQNCVPVAEDIHIDSDNFLKYFRVNSGNLKVMKTVKAEVERFQETLASFKQQYQRQPPALVVDCVFEFQTWMTNEITEAQKRVSSINGFDFCGTDKQVSEQSGHLSSLSNQLKDVLFCLRKLCLGYHAKAGISELRRCPHCGEVWAKLEGCNGGTTCGNLTDGRTLTALDGRSASMHNFIFTYSPGGLTIRHTGSRSVVGKKRDAGSGRGCGKDIVWLDMAPVSVPAEFLAEGAVTVADVALLPAQAAPVWKDTFDRQWSSATAKIQVH
jgi:hypothetical protein